MLEAVKLVSFGAQTLNNYYMYMGSEGLFSSSTTLASRADCPSSSSAPFEEHVDPSETLGAFIERALVADPRRCVHPLCIVHFPRAESAGRRDTRSRRTRRKTSSCYVGCALEISHPLSRPSQSFPPPFYHLSLIFDCLPRSPSARAAS